MPIFFIINIINIQQRMSRYKMPLVINNNRSKQLQKKIQRYKLPILKDQPASQHHFSLNNNSSRIIKIQTLKTSQKNFQFQTDHNRSISQNNNAYDQDVAKQSGNNSSINKNYEQFNEQPMLKIDSLNFSQSLAKNENHKIQSQKSRSNVTNNDRQDSNQEDQQIYISALERQIQKDSKTKNSNYLLINLPTITERQKQNNIRQIQNSLWQQLFKDLEKHEKPIKKIRISKRKLVDNEKRPKTQLKKKPKIQSQRQCRYIQMELKKIRMNSLSNYKLNNLSRKRLKTQNEDLDLQKNDSKRHEIQHKRTIQDAKTIIKNIRKTSKDSKPPIQFYINSYEQIKMVNPFFRKINQLGGCILLNIGTLSIQEADKKLYSQGQTFDNIFILIYGKIVLTDKNKTNKKMILNGQTLGEQALFQNKQTYMQRLRLGQKQYFYKHEARVVNKSCLLSFPLMKYYKVGRQLNKMGYKQLFNLMDNLLRINFINKNNFFSSSSKQDIL